jgi:hypothetical protein
MTRELRNRLPPAPAEPLAPDGQARLGLYQGAFERIDWRAGGVRRLLKQKRWLYACVATREVFAGVAIVDVGYAANAFAYAVDLAGGLLASESFLGVPGLSAAVDGARGRFDGPGVRLRLDRGADGWTFACRTRALSLEASLDATRAPPPAAAVMEVRDGFNATQKCCLLPATGRLRAGGRDFDLAGGLGGLDHTNGLLPRETTWRWAFGLGRAPDGTPVGFNFSDGLSTAPGAENVLWWGDRLVATGPARFTFDPAHPEGAWQVRTDDVDLRFEPRGMHREDRNLGIAKSRFAQVAGLYAGTVRTPDGALVEVADVPGVTEDQFVLW